MDLKRQKDETFSIFNEIASKNDVPSTAVVDYQFVADGPNAAWDNAEKQLISLGFEISRYEDEETLEVHSEPMEMTAENVWALEERLTLGLAPHGFSPDGWGFFGT